MTSSWKARLWTHARIGMCVGFVTLVACSKDIEGPTPTLDPPTLDADPLPVDPGIACREQLTTPITLNGTNFSPIPIDIPDHPGTALPSIMITRSFELDGAGVGAPESVLFSGDPDADPTNAFSSDGDLPLVTWVSRKEMTFTIVPELTLADGDLGTLAEGIWDVTVENANGGSAQSASALALVSKPDFDEITPGITCLQEGERDLRLIGRTILRNGDAKAVLQIDGLDADQSLALEADTCTDIAQPGIDAEMCNEAIVTLAQDLVEEGYYPLTILSPETAACSSVDDVRLRVVPRPAIDRVVPVPGDGSERRGGLGCVAEGPRSFIVEGEDFLRIDDVMPVVTVSDPDGDTSVAYAADSIEGCEDLETQGHTVEVCTSVTFTVPAQGDEDSLAPALYDVMVQNPEPAGCGALSEKALRIVPPPDVVDVVPALVCLGDGEELVELRGMDYLVIEGELPAVSVDGKAVDPDDVVAAECEPLETANLDVMVCDRLDVTLAKDWIKLGKDNYAEPPVEVLNPDPAGCMDAHSDLLTAVGRPEVDEVVASIVCLDQGDRTVRLNGNTFLHQDGREPTLLVEGVSDPFDAVVSDCVDLPQAKREKDLDAGLCTAADVVLAEGSIDPGYPALELLNPETAACVSTDDIKLRVVPAPVIDQVVSSVACLAEGSRAFVIEGQDFLRIDDVTPIVEIASTVYAVDAMNCTENLETQGHTVELCDSITFTVPGDGMTGNLAPDLYDVMVTNPDPAGCGMTATGAVRIVPAPDVLDLAGIQPDLICVDAPVGITITGTDFLVLDDVPPTVQVDGNVIDAGSIFADTANAAKCTALTVDGATAFTCTELMVTIPMDGSSPGMPEVVVTNPVPAGCSDTHSDLLTVFPAVKIDSLDPPNVCQYFVDSAFPITLHGQGFLRVDGNDFDVTFDGSPIAPTDIPAGDCTAIDLPGATSAVTCNTIVTTVDLTGLTDTLGFLDFVVTNNGVVPMCAETATRSLGVVNPPTVDSIDLAGAPIDDQVCADTGMTLILTGDYFADGATVSLTNDSGTIMADMVSVDSAQQITATFSSGLPFQLADPTWDLSVDNGNNCVSLTWFDAITVNPIPLVFFVDPRVVYNEVSVDATVFASGFTAGSTLDFIEIVDSGMNRTVLCDTDNGNAVPDCGVPKPNRFIANIPGETGNPTFAAGDYEIHVTSNIGCASLTGGQLTVTDSFNGTLLSSIEPSYVSPTVATSVTITGMGLLSVPRVYLTPASGTGTATALRAVELKDATRLTAVVPEGMIPGDYNLILVNPDGDVGILNSAVTVTVNEPPRITSVAPATFNANTNMQSATIFGADFSTDAMNVSVTMECRDFTTGMSVVGGTISVDTALATELGVTVDMTGVSAGSVCVITVMNPDGATDTFSAISVKEPAQNLNPWLSTSAMQDGRRALSLVAGRPTESSRRLFAIGGDTGVMNDEEGLGTVLDSVESVDVDLFGQMGTWTYQDNDLSNVNIGGTPTGAARTWAGVERIGRFIYLIGGHNGTGATNTILRTQILDPLAAPQVTDLAAEPGDSIVGLGGGLYNYRVAAVFPDDDPSNPGGESLPGEVLPVQLPNRPELIILSLTWEEIPGASGYRVYRSPAPGDPVSDITLLAELTCGDPGCDCTPDMDGAVSACPLVDDGSVTPTPLPGGMAPVVEGSTGIWHLVEGSRCTDSDCLLTTPREAHATAAVRDPGNANQWILYAMGGRNGGGTAVADGEYAVVSVNPVDGSQTVSDWQPLTATLANARAEVAGFVIADADTNVLMSGQVYVYFGQGRDGMSLVSDFEAGAVSSGGDITSLTGVNEPTPTRVGTSDLSANGWLFVLGGNNGAASSNDTSAEMEAPPPTLSGWTGLGGGSMIEDRIYLGSAKESAFFFIAGGHDGTNALSSTEQTVQ